MKNTPRSRIILMAASLLGVASVAAEDVTAFIHFRGAVVNSPNRQFIQGSYRGEGELDTFNEEVDVDGNMRTRGTARTPRPNILGTYPVRVYARASKGDARISDTFNATAELRRRILIIRGYGKLRLTRNVSIKRPGRQPIRGSGTFRYDF